MIQRPHGLVSGKTLDRGNQISILSMKNLKLMVFMFKMMECCSKDYNIKGVNSTSMLQYQHTWELEQKKTNEAETPKVDKSNGVKTMENIVLHLKLVRGMRGALLVYVVQCHVKVAYILPGYGAYLNLDKKLIARAPILNSMSNLKMTQETLDRAYLSYLVDTFNINNALVYQILSKMFTDMDAYVYVKQRKGMHDSQAVCFDIHKQFLRPDHVARQAAEAEGKLQNSHYDCKREMWDWDKYVALHKEQHAIMKNLRLWLQCYGQ